MKKILFLLFALSLGVMAQAQVTFAFQKGSISNAALQARMEQRITTLLTEINAAANEKRALKLDANCYADRAFSSLNQLWENMRFSCEDDVNIQPCINDQVGFQVRGIPVTLQPEDDSYKGTLYKELTISFDPDATITGVRMSLDNQSISHILKKGSTVTDMRRRREILKFVEDFRSYYNEKNIKALEQVYSDDALIITGKVVMNQKRETPKNESPKVIYSKQSKAEYITKMRRIFTNNKFIDVGFSEIEVVSHPAKDGYYGVTLKQAWNTSTYSDEGYLFLLWDFTGETPVIHVRTWQPDIMTRDEVFTMDDFVI